MLGRVRKDTNRCVRQVMQKSLKYSGMKSPKVSLVPGVVGRDEDCHKGYQAERGDGLKFNHVCSKSRAVQLPNTYTLGSIDTFRAKPVADSAFQPAALVGATLMLRSGIHPFTHRSAVANRVHDALLLP